MEKLPFLEQSELQRIRSQFPILQEKVNGRPLIYFDNAATTQKPKVVIDKISEFYSHENANIHRGVHALSERATQAYENSRVKIAEFIGASSPREIVFTRGSTEAINLLASCLGKSLLKKGDTVLISEMEHHANIVPWQLLRDYIGIRLAVTGVTDDGHLDMEDYYSKLESLRPSLVSIVHVSNSLGIVNPVRRVVEAAHAQNIPVILDCAQSVPHFGINVQELDCDWMVFSAHKLFGPSGVGVLYGKYDRLDALPPYQGGGDMIESVTFEKTVFKSPPERFEAGTPHIAGAITMSTGIEFLESLDREKIALHETALLRFAESGLKEIPGIRLIGSSENKASVVSFVLDAAHPHDIASFLDTEGIAIRSGHHCTQPLMKRLGLSGTARASFSLYNTKEEIEVFLATVQKIQKYFS